MPARSPPATRPSTTAGWAPRRWMRQGRLRRPCRRVQDRVGQLRDPRRDPAQLLQRVARRVGRRLGDRRPGLRRRRVQPLRRDLRDSRRRGRAGPHPPDPEPGPGDLARRDPAPRRPVRGDPLLGRLLGLSPRRDRHRRGRDRGPAGDLQESRGRGPDRGPARPGLYRARHADRRHRRPGRPRAINTQLEAFLPKTDSRSGAVYVFEQLEVLPGTRLQAAGRIEGDRVRSTAALFPGDYLPVEGEDPVHLSADPPLRAEERQRRGAAGPALRLRGEPHRLLRRAGADRLRAVFARSPTTPPRPSRSAIRGCVWNGPARSRPASVTATGRCDSRRRFTTPAIPASSTSA